jgi:DNA-binding MarR family transcriptional regulator
VARWRALDRRTRLDRRPGGGQPELRPAHGLVFQALQRRPMTSTELATVLGVTKQAAGQMVTDLEAKGYLRREDHPEGGRRRLIMLTDEAAKHMRVAGQLLPELEVRVAGDLGGASGHRWRRAAAGSSAPRPRRPAGGLPTELV